MSSALQGLLTEDPTHFERLLPLLRGTSRTSGYALYDKESVRQGLERFLGTADWDAEGE